jgi:hypothetical protein
VNQFFFLIGLSAAVAGDLPVNAHRLDEYLQATRIDLSSNRVDLEIDLTPGVSVANTVLSLMDINHDGNISTAEGDAYAELVLKGVLLEVDQQRHVAKLGSVQFPPVSAMKSGTGTIHLKASAEFEPRVRGPHQLHYQNRHQTNLSVYLINAYVPKSPTIEITRQKRDARQTEIWIDYASGVAVSPPAVGGAGSVNCVDTTQRRRATRNPAAPSKSARHGWGTPASRANAPSSRCATRASSNPALRASGSSSSSA